MPVGVWLKIDVNFILQVWLIFLCPRPLRLVNKRARNCWSAGHYGFSWHNFIDLLSGLECGHLSSGLIFPLFDLRCFSVESLNFCVLKIGNAIYLELCSHVVEQFEFRIGHNNLSRRISSTRVYLNRKITIGYWFGDFFLLFDLLQFLVLGFCNLFGVSAPTHLPIFLERL